MKTPKKQKFNEYLKNKMSVKKHTVIAHLLLNEIVDF